MEYKNNKFILDDSDVGLILNNPECFESTDLHGSIYSFIEDITRPFETRVYYDAREKDVYVWDFNSVSWIISPEFELKESYYSWGRESTGYLLKTMIDRGMLERVPLEWLPQFQLECGFPGNNEEEYKETGLHFPREVIDKYLKGYDITPEFESAIWNEP